MLLLAKMESGVDGGRQVLGDVDRWTRLSGQFRIPQHATTSQAWTTAWASG